jgi:hypothetical protein
MGIQAPRAAWANLRANISTIWAFCQESVMTQPPRHAQIGDHFGLAKRRLSMTATLHAQTATTDRGSRSRSLSLSLSGIALGVGFIVIVAAGILYGVISGAQLNAAAERRWAEEIEQENLAFCAKAGMTPGTDAFVGCANDLTHIRQQHKQRLVNDFNVL